MEFIENIHWLDWTIGGLILGGFVFGVRQGLTAMALRAATYLIALYATPIFRAPVAARLERLLGPSIPPMAANLLAYGVVFLGTFLGFTLLLYVGRKGLEALLTKEPNGQTAQPLDKMGLRLLDRLGGGLVSLVLASLLAGTIVLGLSLADNAELEEKLQGSKLRPVIGHEVELVLAAVPQQYKTELNESLARLHHVAVDKSGEVLGEGSHEISDLLNNVSSDVQNNPNFLKDLRKAIPAVPVSRSSNDGNPQEPPR